MKAMVFAAGYGTRLEPLTRHRPKALVPVANVAMLDRVLACLVAHGTHAVVVNAHHHSGQIVAHVRNRRAFRPSTTVRVEETILGTGGGLRNTEDFWDADDFVVMNGDVLTDIDLAEARDLHRSRGDLVTLILHDAPSFNQIDTAEDGGILRIAPKGNSGRWAFTGIHILNREVLGHIPKGTYSDIIEIYRELISRGAPIRAVISKGHYWRDIGTMESYLAANREYLEGKVCLQGPDAVLDPDAQVADWAVLGPGARIEAHASIVRSVLWEGVRVKEGVRVEDSVVTAHRIVDHNLHKDVL